MQSNKKDEKTVDLRVNSNPDLPVLFVDNLQISTRVDGINFVKLLALVPDGLKEQVLLMIPVKALNNMIDALCQHTNYYPVKKVSKAEETQSPK
jgi:hypothetical protein